MVTNGPINDHKYFHSWKFAGLFTAILVKNKSNINSHKGPINDHKYFSFMAIRGTIHGNSCSQKTTPSVLSDINEGDLRAIKEFPREM